MEFLKSLVRLAEAFAIFAVAFITRMAILVFVIASFIFTVGGVLSSAVALFVGIIAIKNNEPALAGNMAICIVISTAICVVGIGMDKLYRKHK